MFENAIKTSFYYVKEMCCFQFVLCLFEVKLYISYRKKTGFIALSKLKSC